MRSKTHSKGLQSLSWISELQIKKWQSALKEISKRAFEQFRPPERMTVSEWADRRSCRLDLHQDQVYGPQILYRICVP